MISNCYGWSSDPWLAILQGNTHHRWGWFDQGKLDHVEIFSSRDAPAVPESLEIWIAQVGFAPGILKDRARVHRIQTDQIPIQDLYSTIGIDRALGLWAAGERRGWPTLVIDAGTALTLTGAAGDHRLVGGAILPGLTTQTRSLFDRTATLPWLNWQQLDADPPLWAMDTVSAIYSGIHHMVVAGLRWFCTDWLQTYPTSSVVITGGDGELIYQWLKPDPQLKPRLQLEPDLVLWGISLYRDRLMA